MTTKQSSTGFDYRHSCYYTSLTHAEAVHPNSYRCQIFLRSFSKNLCESLAATIMLQTCFPFGSQAPKLCVPQKLRYCSKIFQLVELGEPEDFCNNTTIFSYYSGLFTFRWRCLVGGRPLGPYFSNTHDSTWRSSHSTLAIKSSALCWWHLSREKNN